MDAWRLAHRRSVIQGHSTIYIYIYRVILRAWSLGEFRISEVESSGMRVRA